MFMMSKMNSLMNKSMLFWKRVTSSRNTILKYEHIAPHVSSRSIFTRIVQKCCADLNQHNTVCIILIKIDVLDTCGATLSYFGIVMKFHQMSCGQSEMKQIKHLTELNKLTV